MSNRCSLLASLMLALACSASAGVEASGLYLESSGDGTSADSVQASHFSRASRSAKNNQPTRVVLQSLQKSFDDGSFSFIGLKFSPDFRAVRSPEAWPTVISALQRRQPWVEPFDRLLTMKDPPETQALLAERAWPHRHLMRESELALFNQFAGAAYTYAGDYRSAALTYGNTAGTRDPRRSGFVMPEDAIGAIIEDASDERAVFLNESHGRGETRAFAFLVATALFDRGFNYLSLEGLSSKSTEAKCGESAIFDEELVSRGYAVRKTGHYTNDPIFAELIRVALSKGVKIIAHTTGGGSVGAAAREQVQAERIACIFSEDPEARVVAIGGFAHISEREGHTFPEGLMGRRFIEASGINPLTIDSTVLIDTPALADEKGADDNWGAYLFSRAPGDVYRVDGFDYNVALPTASSRSVSSEMLRLGGHRQLLIPASLECGDPPCVISARRSDELADSVPADACITRSRFGVCSLYVPCGNYTIEIRDSTSKETQTQSRHMVCSDLPPSSGAG